MKHKIIAEDKKHLLDIIQKEIELDGNECDSYHLVKEMRKDLIDSNIQSKQLKL